MKNFVKTATSLALSLSILGFSVPNAYADVVFLTVYDKDGNRHGIVNDWDSHKEFVDFNKKYLNGAGEFIIGGTWDTGYHVALPNSSKRTGVRKLALKDDMAFASREAAKDFCDELANLGVAISRRPIVIDTKATPRPGYSVMLSDIDRIINRVIAVPYEIAYGKGSQEAEDKQTSTKARKYFFCPNPGDWMPNPNKGGDDENESTGIRKVDLREEQVGDTKIQYYDVTCMNTPLGSAPITFKLLKTVGGSTQWRGVKPADPDDKFPYVYYYWVTSSTPTLHQLNEQVGAQYCPMG
jgi:hypothetical protein